MGIVALAPNRQLRSGELLQSPARQGKQFEGSAAPLYEAVGVDHHEGERHGQADEDRHEKGAQAAQPDFKMLHLARGGQFLGDGFSSSFPTFADVSALLCPTTLRSGA